MKKKKLLVGLGLIGLCFVLSLVWEYTNPALAAVDCCTSCTDYCFCENSNHAYACATYPCGTPPCIGVGTKCCLPWYPSGGGGDDGGEGDDECDVYFPPPHCV